MDLAGEKKLGIEWSNFKWSTKSGLKNAAVTDIILSMLQVAGIISETHIYMQPAVVSFEQDTDAGIIEEEDPKNNVQPAEADIGLDIDNEKS